MTSFLLTILAFNAHCPWPFVPFDTVASPQPTPPTTPHKYPILDLLDIFVFLANLATNLAYLASPPAQIITRASIWSSKSWFLPPLIQNARVTNLPNIHTLIWPRNPFLSTRPYLPLLLHLLYFPPGSLHFRNTQPLSVSNTLNLILSWGCVLVYSLPEGLFSRSSHDWLLLSFKSLFKCSPERSNLLPR